MYGVIAPRPKYWSGMPILNLPKVAFPVALGT